MSSVVCLNALISIRNLQTKQNLFFFFFVFYMFLHVCVCMCVHLSTVQFSVSKL